MKIHDYTRYLARIDGAASCAIQGDREITFAAFEANACQLANALVDRGLAAGDRIGLLSRNSIEMPLVYVACSRAGIVPVPINWRLTPHEITGLLADAGATVLLAQSEFAAQLAESGIACIDLGPSGAQVFAPFYDWLGQYPVEFDDVEQPDSAVLYQMYTSGTTGFPKGALISHAGVAANMQQNMLLLNHCFGRGKRCLLVMPMFHAGAASTVIGCLCSGTTMVIHEAFEPRAFVESAQREGVTVINSVPAMLQAVLQLPGVHDMDFPQLEAIIYGASPIAVDTLRGALDLFKCEFYQGYGQTESSAVISFLSHDDHIKALSGHEELLLSAGRPVVGTQVRIVDGDGNTLPVGANGEIVVRGPQVMNGYWQREEATSKTLAGGWLHTGDVGHLDDEGYLYIEDRLKDMIVSGGENIYPRELENCLMNHPDIVDAAVIGIPDEKYGETPLAFVVQRPGAGLSDTDVLAWCREYLAGFKQPRRVEFAEMLPRNPSGKVLKQELRAPFWQDKERAV